jgi:2-polyprenyl-3-methyl-5-hydroxy-6-metoxy-1,4-benzoquinol methylase
MCPRTARYLDHLVGVMDLGNSISFYGRIPDIDEWYRDKGVLISTTLYESFGMNIGEAMASGCWPVVHHYPGAEKTWPADCLFATVDQAVARIQQAQHNQYRSFVVDRYSLQCQERAVRNLLGELMHNDFDPRSYWQQRHASLQGSIRAVGHIGLSEAENFKDYATNATHLHAALLARFPEPKGRVLFDAGCGTGMVSAFCAELGFEIVGVDFSDVAIAQARKRVPRGIFTIGAFDQVSGPPADVVICFDVLFHILDGASWARGLEALANRLKPGGRMLILEHFPGTASSAQHVRWRSLDAYRQAAASLGLTLSQVDTYRLPHLGAEKSLLVLDKAPETATASASSVDLAPDMMIAS